MDVVALLDADAWDGTKFVLNPNTPLEAGIFDANSTPVQPTIVPDIHNGRSALRAGDPSTSAVSQLYIRPTDSVELSDSGMFLAAAKMMPDQEIAMRVMDHPFQPKMDVGFTGSNNSGSPRGYVNAQTYSPIFGHNISMGSSFFPSSTPFSDIHWYAVTWDSTSAKAYFDGVLVADFADFNVDYRVAEEFQFMIHRLDLIHMSMWNGSEDAHTQAHAMALVYGDTEIWPVAESTPAPEDHPLRASNLIQFAPDLSNNGMGSEYGPWDTYDRPSNTASENELFNHALLSDLFSGYSVNPLVWHKFFVPTAGDILVTQNLEGAGDEGIPTRDPEDTVLILLRAPSGVELNDESLSPDLIVAVDDQSGGESAGLVRYREPQGNRWYYIGHMPYANNQVILNQWVQVTAPTGEINEVIPEGRLIWDEPPTGGSPITGYRIYLVEDDLPRVVETTERSYLLPDGYIGPVLVTAVNAIGESMPIPLDVGDLGSTPEEPPPVAS